MSLFPEKFDDWMLDKNFYDLKKGQHIMTIPRTGYYKARISLVEKFGISTRNELKMEVNQQSVWHHCRCMANKNDFQIRKSDTIRIWGRSKLWL